MPDPTEPSVQRKRPIAPRTAKQIKGQQAEDLVAAYKAGATVYELGSRFGISRQTVSSILKRQNIETRWRKFTDEQVDTAVRLYQQGMPLAQVGERLNASPETIRKSLLKRGVKVRDRHGRGQ
ncbi:helix-turn-helix domain-containing protein [Streptomyces sp. NPDC007057]|uniref:helix-turn-helix domain-containing protein n=1 Tax=Streptomyces sp. NPDC007057 TaxID=3154586 RepID=UPI0033D67F97